MKPVVFSSPKQEMIHQRLYELVGPGPAMFYRDACWLMASDFPLTSTTHLIAHLLRDIESALRDVLETFVEPVVFSWNYCESAWCEVENGNWELIEGSHQGNVANPGTRITLRLVVEDGKFTVYINNKQRSSLIMEEYAQGRVYILLGNQSVVDNIHISQLP